MNKLFHRTFFTKEIALILILINTVKYVDLSYKKKVKIKNS